VGKKESKENAGDARRVAVIRTYLTPNLGRGKKKKEKRGELQFRDGRQPKHERKKKEGGKEGPSGNHFVRPMIKREKGKKSPLFVHPFSVKGERCRGQTKKRMFSFIRLP